MRPLLLASIFAAFLAVGLPARAQHDHHAAPPAGEVVIRHGPLDSIGMPPMSMAFGVADKRWLDELKAGDKIGFAAAQQGSNAVVSRYEAIQ